MKKQFQYKNTEIEEYKYLTYYGYLRSSKGFRSGAWATWRKWGDVSYAPGAQFRMKSFQDTTGMTHHVAIRLADLTGRSGAALPCRLSRRTRLQTQGKHKHNRCPRWDLAGIMEPHRGRSIRVPSSSTTRKGPAAQRVMTPLQQTPCRRCYHNRRKDPVVTTYTP